MTHPTLKSILIKVLSFAKRDTEHNIELFYMKYEKLLQVVYTLKREEPSSLTIQDLIDRFELSHFEIDQFVKACGIFDTYDNSTVLKFSKSIDVYVRRSNNDYSEDPVNVEPEYYRPRFSNSLHLLPPRIYIDRKDEIVEIFKKELEKISNGPGLQFIKEAKMSHYQKTLDKILKTPEIKKFSDIYKNYEIEGVSRMFLEKIFTMS
jgi:hypothetical protein